MATAALKRTPLHEAHRAAGAKLVPFAGWEMPVSYEGVRQEHVAVRTSCGVFDVSHMGEIETSGPHAARFLQRLLSNDITQLTEGGAHAPHEWVSAASLRSRAEVALALVGTVLK